MQIIQSIRDKGAAIVIAVIALSLIGFILMDAQQGGSRLFSSFSTTIGKVNGEKIELNDFNKIVQIAEDNLQRQNNGQRPSGFQTYQLRDKVWNQLVSEKIIVSEASKLGIDFTAKEMNYLLTSNDPNNPLAQEPSLKDSATGKLDQNKAKSVLDGLKKKKGEEKELLQFQFDQIAINNIRTKYSTLITAAAYYPSWMQTVDQEETKAFANISYVNIPYTDVTDSTLKVTDEDIKNYISKNKELFKQEAGRFISYITFSQKPTLSDSNAVKETLYTIKDGFKVDTNAKAFVALNKSTIEFNDLYTPKNKLSFLIKDTVSKLQKGEVFGPYIEYDKYVLAKLLDTKEMPDSIKCRHILISTTNEKGEETLDTVTAKKRIDSISAAIASGANFEELEAKYSTDRVAHEKKGEMTIDIITIQNKDRFASEFGDFLLNEKGETKNVVKTSFGWHYIEILQKINPQPAYKIAYLAKDIMASDETLNKSQGDAIKASAAKNKEALKKMAESNGLSLIKNSVVVKENDYTVGTFQDARSLVKWAFDAKVGDISEPISIGEQYIIAVVDKVVDEGTQDVETARQFCETIILNQKKAEVIKKKLAAATTLDAAAAAFGKTVQNAGADSTLTFSASAINGIGAEQKVIGAAFNKTYQSKISPAIVGNAGVTMIKVNSIQNKPADTPEMMALNAKQRIANMRSQVAGWSESLRKQAKIEDNRSDHF